jgi:parallel beta-helix repeat protein
MNNPARIVNTCSPVSIVLALLSFLLLGPQSVSQATTYYVDGNSPAARDANPGTEAEPWKTISQATPLLQAGDTLLIKAGIYRETVLLSQSGTAAAPITIRACPGQEGKAVINAAELVSHWRKCTGPEECSGNPHWEHIYYADVAGLVDTHPDKTFAVRQVFQHGRLLPRSRYPNAGWRYPTTIADPKKTFTDSSLSQPEGYFAGAVCHIKTAVWQMDAVPITAFSRGTITLAASPMFNIAPRFGYFITNIVGEINAEGEWAYDPAQKRIFLWPKGDMAEGVEFTYRQDCLRTDTGIAFNVVRGLTMRNAWGYGILVCRSHDLVIENNTIEHTFNCGIRLQAEGGSCDNNQIIRNTVKYSCSSGINVDGTASHYTVEGNYVYATGVEHFGDDLLNGLGHGVFVWGPYARVCNNRVDRTAKDALYLGGQPIHREICFNHITNTGLALSDDGSGLYTGGYHPGPEKDHIHHNIFAESIGCNTMDKAYDAGLPVTIEKYGGGSPGLYVDEEGNNRIIEHNTVINTRYAGIFFHGAPSNLVRKNTCYGNKEMQVLLVGRANWAGRTRDRMRLVDDIVQDNILFATDAQQRTLHLTTYYEDFHFGRSDRNYFYNPYTNAHIHVDHYVAARNGQVRTTVPLDQWRTMSGYDRNSKDISDLRRLPQVTLVSPVKSRIVYNASLDVNTVDLGPDLYCDVQGNGIRGKLVLQPFESKILIAAVDATVSDQATNPVPADGGQVGIGPMLEWTAAARAACHNVYLGMDKDAVSAADTASPLFRGRQTGTSFSLQGLVQPSTRYFWRADEVETDGTTTHKGVIWTFTVSGYLAIDDFENYTDTKGSRLEETWSDGSLNHTGAQASRASNLSTGWADDAHGKWSMSLAYDNAKPPRVSEVERKFAPEQDWTVGATDTLSLWYRGDLVSFGETTPGTFVMSAAGADIWGARDEFRYAYKRLDGDGAMAVKIENLAGMDYWTKAGVMIRESLDPSSAHAFMLVIPDGLRAFQNRPANDSSMCFAAQGDAESKIPSWVKLERKGNQFTGYHSVDGINWIRQSDRGSTGPDASPNPQTINMASSVYVGLALSSHAPGVMTTATFSGVKITGNATDQWQVADIGVDHPGNSPDNLYVTVEDSKGKTATVIHPDPAAVNARAWTEWKIPLNSFSGVDLRRVGRISIGVGGREGAIPLGTGRIHIDDIRVLPSEPAY